MSAVIAVFAEVCCPLSFLARQRLLSSVGWGVSFLVVFLKALLGMMALVALRYVHILNDEQKNERFKSDAVKISSAKMYLPI